MEVALPTVVSAHPTRWCVPLRRRSRTLGWEKGVGDCRNVAVTVKDVNFGSLEENSRRRGETMSFSGCVVLWRKLLPSTVVSVGEPTLATMMCTW